MTFCPAVHVVIPPTQAHVLDDQALQATQDGKFGGGGTTGCELEHSSRFPWLELTDAHHRILFATRLEIGPIALV
jgi:hypothetical protein